MKVFAPCGWLELPRRDATPDQDADECSRGTCGDGEPPFSDRPACVMTDGKRSCREVKVCCIDPSACA